MYFFLLLLRIMFSYFKAIFTFTFTAEKLLCSAWFWELWNSFMVQYVNCRSVMWKMETGIVVCQEIMPPNRIYIVLDYWMKEEYTYLKKDILLLIWSLIASPGVMALSISYNRWNPCLSGVNNKPTLIFILKQHNSNSVICSWSSRSNQGYVVNRKQEHVKHFYVKYIQSCRLSL